MKQFLILFTLLFFACDKQASFQVPEWNAYDETLELSANESHDIPRMRYKLIQSKFRDKNEIWKDVENQLSDFSDEDYQRIHRMVYDNDIIGIQGHVESKDLSYKELVQWYLYRILKFENDPKTSLYAIISLNKNAVKQAKAMDKKRGEIDHPIYGMPILLKDNINTEGMPTTAGAIALSSNMTSDAHIVKQLKSKGAIILGKVNLSEWAYFFCQGCPLGYSAVGGQSLNPYGRMQFETGGSSAGSGTSMAAQYAVAAVGTETSGSILSPSSMNSLVGLKPTIGRLSRSGIVPISSTLDTPGPMTRNVSDNSVLLSAMQGFDADDGKMQESRSLKDPLKYDRILVLEGKRFGYFEDFLEQDLYREMIEKIRKSGVELVGLNNPDFDYSNFSNFLSGDMKFDLPNYLKNQTGEEVSFKTIEEIVSYNLEDTLIRMPYGQLHFENTVDLQLGKEEIEQIKEEMQKAGRIVFDPLEDQKLDAILSINNWHAGPAALAQYPCLTLPMGYKEDGEPQNLTLISSSFDELNLFSLAHALEKNIPMRKNPELFNDQKEME